MSGTISGTANRRLGGVTQVCIDGTFYGVVSDVNWSPSSLKRESLIGLSGVQGYSEMPVTGYIEATLRDNGGITVGDFQAMTNSTVQVLLANGKSVVGNGMWLVEVVAVHAQEGTFQVKFESNDVSEVTI